MNSSYRFNQADIGVFAQESVDPSLERFGPSCHIVGMTMGQFSLIDLIHGVLKRTGPAELYIATWSAGIKDAYQVRWMLDTDLITGIRLLTDHSYVGRQKRYAASIEELFGPENIRTSEMHAKFVVIKNAEWSVVILSSMNLNANRTCEVFTIYEDSEMCAFFERFMAHHFDNLKAGWERSSTVVRECVERFIESEKVAPKRVAPPADWWSEA